MATSSTELQLKLLVEARLGAAIIGRAGHVVRRIKQGSGVQHIHLSDNAEGAIDRTVTVTGTREALLQAYALIAQVLRAEDGLTGDAELMRMLVPDAPSIIGDVALRGVQSISGATVEASTPARDSPAQHSEKVVSCIGTAEQTERAVTLLADAVNARHQARHSAFLSQWAFETSYNDHFETPERAFADVLPLLRCIGVQSLRRRQRKRRRESVDDMGKDATANGTLGELTVYDPYYCQGSVRRALVGLGLAEGCCLNSNEDFYQAHLA